MLAAFYATLLAVRRVLTDNVWLFAFSIVVIIVVSIVWDWLLNAIFTGPQRVISSLKKRSAAKRTRSGPDVGDDHRHDNRGV